ncbi:cyclic nucleotide-regulated ABC bacteriocin/lantibiotic exporter [Candidatus Magnetoovum chiemensis]|nr:cyclic nucleotide-regulated ABC bacteriocin/lantibiotic exporter [Candidatus Magnetoovum chiemensis]
MAESIDNASKRSVKRPKPVRTPTALQMEAVECGAACLAMVLAYYGLHVPLERMRLDCGVSRDGSKANNMLKAARKYGLTAKGFKKEPAELYSLKMPAIIFWNFNHFVVLNGFKGKKVSINDPGSGPRWISDEEFDQSFTGVVLTFEKAAEFIKGGAKPSLLKALAKRLKGSASALIFVILISLFLVVPGIIVPTFSKVFIDNIWSADMINWMLPLLWAMAATALLRMTLTWVQQYYLLRMESKFALSSAGKFLWHVLRLPVEFFTQRYAGDIANRVAINDRIATLISGELATNAINLLMIVFYAVVMFQYDIVLTLVGITIGFSNFIFLKYISRKRADANKKLQQERGKLQGTSMDGLQIIETLKSSGAETDFFAKWAGYEAKVVNAEQQLGLTTSLLTVVPPFLTALTSSAILIVGGLRVMEGAITVGMLTAFQSLMASFINPINQLVTLGGSIQETEADMNRLDDVLGYDIDNVFKENINDHQDSSAKLSGEVCLNNISFGYSRLEAPLIENFSLNLLPGTRVALVGGSGSGKSTISKIISGMYEPWEGEILFDGKVRSIIPRQSLNNSLAMVDQNIFLFEGTIKDNITLWDTTISDENIITAAKDACIHEDIAARAGGYDSKVEEGGSNFSGGQRQRIEIARALAVNPSIVVLDEATSALDAKTESIVDDNLRRRGCTCIIIAHRLSTIRDCDEIIVLDRGKVAQRGTHDELIKIDGLYKKLVEST